MEEIKNIRINISAGTIVKVVVVLAVVGAIYFLRDLVLVLLTAVVIASAIAPMANWLVAHWRAPRVLAVLAVYVTAFLIIFGILFFLVPPLFKDFSDFAFKIPAELSALIQSNSSWQAVVNLAGDFSTKVSVQDVINKGVFGSSVPGDIFDFTRSLFTHLFDFILIIVLSFYLAVQKNGVENLLRVVIPNRQEEYVIDLWRRTETKIGLWMQGQLILALVIGPLVFLGLAIFQIKYALTLAIIASVFELIPIFGPVLSAVPAVMLGFSDSVTLGLIMIGFYVIVQQLENHLLYPLVVKKIIGVNPLVVIISMVVGYSLAGFLGVVLAVPLATLLMEFVGDLDKRKHVNV